jgi:hypothetical protein
MRKRVAVKARVTQIKKYFDNLQENVDVHNANFRLQLLEKAWEEWMLYRIMMMNELDRKDLQKHTINWGLKLIE